MRKVLGAALAPWLSAQTTFAARIATLPRSRSIEARSIPITRNIRHITISATLTSRDHVVVDNADPGKIRATEAIYLPVPGLYVLISAYWPGQSQATPNDVTTFTTWDVWQTPHPWGPWTKAATRR